MECPFLSDIREKKETEIEKKEEEKIEDSIFQKRQTDSVFDTTVLES